MKPISIKGIDERILSFIAKNKLINKNDKILIGFSGGADSRFVLYFLQKYVKMFSLQIAVMHINHNLRGDEAKRDLLFCKNTAEKLGVPFYSAEIDVKSYAKQNRLSIEEAARILRYNKLEDMRSGLQFDKICTAHNMNDNSETILLNLFKGAGTKGISGIPPKRDRIIRPILTVTRNEIEAYLNKLNLDFITDSSNNDINYLRNKIRIDILPEIRKTINPKVDMALLKFAELMRGNNQALEHIVTQIKNNIFVRKKDTLELLLDENDNISDFLLNTTIKTEILDFFGQDFDFNDMEKISRLIKSQKGTKIEFKNRLKAVKESRKIIFTNSESSPEDLFIQFKIGDKVEFSDKLLIVEPTDSVDRESGCEIISSDNLTNFFILRSWKKGDKFTPLGMKTRKKISDFLTDIKISNSERKNVLVLENNGEIIWIVGYRISEKVRINNTTENKLKLCVKKKN